MKKIILLITMMVGLTLTACGNSTTKTTIGTTGAIHHNIVNISFSSWGDPVFEQKMIDAFEVQYPWIHVYLDTTITGSGSVFTANLVAAAQAGTIPDVFAIDNVPTAIQHGLTYDMASLWNNDPDTAKVYPNIAATGQYGDVRYAAPSYQYIKGVIVNKTLLEDAGLDVPGYDWTYQDMIDLATDFSDSSSYMYGISGDYGNFDAVLPSLDDSSVGYMTYDGTQFHFDSPAWISAYNLMNQLRAQGVEENMTGDEKEAIFGDPNAWPFAAGHVLMMIDGSWDLPYILSTFDGAGYDIAFYPYPGGDAGQRIPVILDYMCISSQTQYPDEAYLLLKWMSWGEDGWNARLQIMDEMNTPVTALPTANYPEVWSQLETMAGTIDGMKENIDLIGNAVPDTDKWLPGYNDFWAWLSSDENPYKDQFPNMTPQQFAPIWEQKVNELINQAYETLGLEK